METESIGTRVKKIRTTLKMNQKSFAAELGISQNHVSSIENGKENPSGALKKLICTKFNINEQWLEDANGGMYPDFDTRTDEGLINKYKDVRYMLDEIVKERTGKEREYTVLAISYLTGLLSGDRIKEEFLEDYLVALCGCIDTMERLEFRSATVTNFGKKAYEFFLKYRTNAEVQLRILEDYVREMNNVVLQQYEIDGLKL